MPSSPPAAISLVPLDDADVMIRLLGRQTEGRQVCMPGMGTCSGFSAAGSLIYVQLEKWR